MGRLVIVSNRVGPVTDSGRAGGLAVALSEALRASGGVWFGWSGHARADADDTVHTRREGSLTLATLDLRPDEVEDYYEGFANRCLWPLFHYRVDLTAFHRRYYEGYAAVNRRFARALAPLLRPDDVVWVHDYHFLALGCELRRLGARHRIGFFLHIPVPSGDVLASLPSMDPLVRALCACDVLGFQTDADRDRFVRHVLAEHGGTLSGDVLQVLDRPVVVRAFPIGIDADRFAEWSVSPQAQEAAARVRRENRGRVQVIGVDRLDYTKGLPERFRAFERLLDRSPELQGQVSLLQVAPLSRKRVDEYQHLREELEGLAGRVNGRFGRVDWTPIRYLNQGFQRRELAGLLRASRVGLVTPLRDGMNLVAKEYVAAQDPDDPGVLVLSRFAGAARQLREALIVNPYDVDAVAEAVQRSIRMDLAERRARHAALRAALHGYDVTAWREDFLGALRRVP